MATLALVFPASAQAVGTASERERSLLAEMNRARAVHGLAPLQHDRRLERAARAHSADMMRRDYFSHGAFTRRMRSFGIRGRLFGENVAWGAGSYATPRAIVRMWMASPPHRANLLRASFRRAGLGAVVGKFAGHSGATVVTADFAG